MSLPATLLRLVWKVCLCLLDIAEQIRTNTVAVRSVASHLRHPERFTSRPHCSTLFPSLVLKSSPQRNHPGYLRSKVRSSRESFEYERHSNFDMAVLVLGSMRNSMLYTCTTSIRSAANRPGSCTYRTEDSHCPSALGLLKPSFSACSLCSFQSGLGSSIPSVILP